MTLDIDFVRAQFPAFSEPSLEGHCFFENAGGSYTCQQVIDRLTRFYTQRKVQPYAPYEASRLAGEEMDEARNRLSAILGVLPHELSFGPSTTQNTYVLARAFRKWMKPGDAIIVTNQDHEANTGPWRRLADEGFELLEWRIDPETGHLDPAALDDRLDERVRLVCFPHCSNVVGEINPVAEIAEAVRKRLDIGTDAVRGQFHLAAQDLRQVLGDGAQRELLFALLRAAEVRHQDRACAVLDEVLDRRQRLDHPRRVLGQHASRCSHEPEDVLVLAGCLLR